ncbi:hypothetical protein D3C78_1194290 [compost metagenome]
MAQGRQFPVQQADHARLAGVEHQVVEAVVAVHQGGFVAWRNVLGQPVHQLLHGRVDGQRGFAALARPAADLAREVVARPAIVGQAHGAMVHAVQRGDHPVHLTVDGLALGGRHARQGLVHQHPAGEKLHQIERRADQRRVVAIGEHARHRHRAALQGAHDAVLAVDGMGRGHQQARRLGAQHIAAAAGRELVRRVGLAAGQRRERRLLAVAQALRLQVGGQPLPGFGSRRGHAPALSAMWTSLRAMLQRCTSLGPS